MECVLTSRELLLGIAAFQPGDHDDTREIKRLVHAVFSTPVAPLGTCAPVHDKIQRWLPKRGADGVRALLEASLGPHLVRYALMFGSVAVFQHLGIKRLMLWGWLAAAEHGHVALFEYLATWSCEHEADALRTAINFGHVDLVAYFYARGHRPRDAFRTACLSGHAGVAAFAHTHGLEEPWTPATVNVVAARGHTAVLQLLHELRYDGFSAMTLAMAAAAGHLDCVQYLMAHLEHCDATGALVAAACNNQHHVAAWLARQAEFHQSAAQHDAGSGSRPAQTSCFV
ncbi:hypothetical protein ACHHYP_14512 [Achlya hypogyna]|uniref:Uncharacterized protein n=1 Tax=Achlya hypogyna TaxID=1202772 RepID=A0A1V9YD05_ACHHY|nr:hypothetical protein ACHHYP_14512 [Achlya hypogyna]